ncbi:hypothetical protein J6590_039949 [Homalodisca vitripennis]|nr:hypothetical protein J6590_039943 [Homalodisca vitripennis]KAG8326487.1 hypothetical protein J6590_039949 [Homalodisca vitripennis]
MRHTRPQAASTFDPTFSHQEYEQDEATLGVRNWLPCVTHDHRRRLRSTQLSPTKNTDKMRRHRVFGTGCHASHTTTGGGVAGTDRHGMARRWETMELDD